MKKFYQLKSLNMIVNQLREEEAFDPKDDDNEIKDDNENMLEFVNGYCNYKTDQTAKDELTAGKPTSAVTIGSQDGREEMFLVMAESNKLV